MSFILEFIMEIVFDLIFEGSFLLCTNKKVPLPIRILATLICTALYLAVIALIAIIGIVSLKDNNPGLALPVFALDILLIILSIRQFRKEYLSRYSDGEQSSSIRNRLEK